jgi:hypothetical protein
VLLFMYAEEKERKAKLQGSRFVLFFMLKRRKRSKVRKAVDYFC